MGNISDFLSKMQGGGARPNQFRVKLAFPTIALVGDTGLLTKAAGEATFLCHATQMPSSDIQDIVVSYRGRPVHFAGERAFGQWTVSIYNDNNFNIKAAFEAWSHGILRLGSTKGTLNPSTDRGITGGYTTEMAVTQLDRNDNPLREYQFKYCYPISVGGIALNFDSNAIETFDVTFVYNYFLIASSTKETELTYPDDGSAASVHKIQ